LQLLHGESEGGARMTLRSIGDLIAPADRRAHERDLLAGYVAALSAAGLIDALVEAVLHRFSEAFRDLGTAGALAAGGAR
jgi:hypothetical protein